MLDGTVTAQMEGEPVRHYEAGQAWFERRAQRHVALGNDGDTGASVLVFFLTERGQPVLSFDAD